MHIIDGNGVEKGTTATWRYNSYLAVQQLSGARSKNVLLCFLDMHHFRDLVMVVVVVVVVVVVE